MSNQVPLGATLLRVAVASVFVIHGVTRLMNAGVGGFGEFIGSWGLPAGVALAWAITVVEVLGGMSLAAGFGVRVLAAWFAIVIGTGIVMVHAATAGSSSAPAAMAPSTASHHRQPGRGGADRPGRIAWAG